MFGVHFHSTLVLSSGTATSKGRLVDSSPIVEIGVIRSAGQVKRSHEGLYFGRFRVADSDLPAERLATQRYYQPKSVKQQIYYEGAEEKMVLKLPALESPELTPWFVRSYILFINENYNNID